MWNLASFLLGTLLVSMQDRCMVYTRRTIGSEIVLVAPDGTTRLKWNLISVHLEIVLILTQDRFRVCVERNIGSEIILHAPDGAPW